MPAHSLFPLRRSPHFLPAPKQQVCMHAGIRCNAYKPNSVLHPPLPNHHSLLHQTSAAISSVGIPPQPHPLHACTPHPPKSTPTILHQPKPSQVVPVLHFRVFYLLCFSAIWNHRHDVVFRGLLPSIGSCFQRCVSKAVLWAEILKPEDRNVISSNSQSYVMNLIIILQFNDKFRRGSSPPPPPPSKKKKPLPSIWQHIRGITPIAKTISTPKKKEGARR